MAVMVQPGSAVGVEAGDLNCALAYLEVDAWTTLNSRLEAPADLQLTLFTDDLA
jgi:hypothetical protein